MKPGAAHSDKPGEREKSGQAGFAEIRQSQRKEAFCKFVIEPCRKSSLGCCQSFEVRNHQRLRDRSGCGMVCQSRFWHQAHRDAHGGLARNIADHAKQIATLLCDLEHDTLAQ